jgi:hypothetical protein
MKSQATAVIINWQRQSNIDKIIDTLRSQSIKIKIILWHNGVEPIKQFQCDEYYISSRNHICWPRWFVASQSDTEFVFCLDDDICPIDSFIIEKIINYHEKLGKPRSITGIEGVHLERDCGYFPNYSKPWMRKAVTEELKGSSIHLGYVDSPTYVDIIKGRFMLCRAVDLNIPMSPQMRVYADDIAISGLLAGGRSKAHLLAQVSRDSFIDLADKDGPMALCQQSFIRPIREEARKFYFQNC